MSKGLKNQSIRSLIVITYFSITLPALVLAWTTLALVERDAALSEYRVVPTADLNVEQTKLSKEPANFLTKLGYNVALLIDQPYKQNKPLRQLWLFDTSQTLFIMWVLLLLLGLSIVFWLTSSINKPFKILSDKVNSLGANKLDTPVVLNGPKDIVLISEGVNQLRIRLRENERQQHQFLRHISHEIKTPLTSIKEGTQLLEDELLGPINSEQREITNILIRSTAELQESIENLLNYNSLISNKNIKQRERVDLKTLIHNSLDKQALPIKNKRLVIKLNLAKALAFVDREQINTVFDNLLSNAIKFSPNQGVIKLALVELNAKVIFNIEDQGPGVNDEQKLLIFEAFYVGDKIKHTTLKGTGLGLSIAKQYVETHHDGTLRLLNSKSGAIFQMVLNV